MGDFDAAKFCVSPRNLFVSWFAVIYMLSAHSVSKVGVSNHPFHCGMAACEKTAAF